MEYAFVPEPLEDDFFEDDPQAARNNAAAITTASNRQVRFVRGMRGGLLRSGARRTLATACSLIVVHRALKRLGAVRARMHRMTATELLYLRDAYLASFDATVVDVDEQGRRV